MKHLLRLLLITVSICLVFPTVSLAHSGKFGSSINPMSANNKSVDSYWRKAPRAVAGRCAKFINVPAQGASCKDEVNDQWLVKTRNGIVPTHGPDTLQDLLPAASTSPAVNRAGTGSVNDIVCKNSGSRVRVIYAWPNNQSPQNRTPALLRQAVYDASHHIDERAKELSPGARGRLHVQCANNDVDVLSLQVNVSSANDSFASIVSALQTAGQTDRNIHYLVYWDSPAGNYPASGLGGQGYVQGDDRDTPANANNAVSYAIQYAYNGKDYTNPLWSILLHETSHNMGAVQPAAPESTGNGWHCNEGHDIMCYADGGNRSEYIDNTCAGQGDYWDGVYDCHADTYFNPAPCASAYLATHWNIASVNNLFIEHGSPTVPPDQDCIAPTAPANLIATQTATRTFTLNWTASSDTDANLAYRVLMKKAGGAWKTTRALRSSSNYGGMQLTNQAKVHCLSDKACSAVGAPDKYDIKVQAVDAAGNMTTSAVYTYNVSTPVGNNPLPPVSPEPDKTAPTKVSLSAPQSTTKAIVLSWTAATDDVLVTKYSVWLKTNNQWKIVATTTNLGYMLENLNEKTTYQIGVTAHDAAGNVSERTEITASTLMGLDTIDLVAPAPVIPSIRSLHRNAVVISWIKNTDQEQVSGYGMYLKKGHDPWKLQQHLTAKPSAYRFKRLSQGVRYRFAVRTIGNEGDASMMKGTRSVLIADTVRPRAPRNVFASKRARTNLTFRFTGAFDNVRVVKYQVQMRVYKGKWRRAVTTRRAAIGYKRLHRCTVYQVRVRSLDGAGNASAWRASRATRTLC